MRPQKTFLTLATAYFRDLKAGIGGIWYYGKWCSGPKGMATNSNHALFKETEFGFSLVHLTGLCLKKKTRTAGQEQDMRD